MPVLTGADFDGRKTSIVKALFKRSNCQQSKRQRTKLPNIYSQHKQIHLRTGATHVGKLPNIYSQHKQIQLRKGMVDGLKRFFARLLPQNDNISALALNGTPLRSRLLLVQALNDKQICNPEPTERYPEPGSISQSKCQTKRFRTKFGMTKDKAAFTLAEVLITLGIIGVVAAMTIPNLITTHQKKVTVTKLQKAISVLNQAYKTSYEEVGEPDDAFLLGSEAYFNTYWAPFVKTAVLCETSKKCGFSGNVSHPRGTSQGFDFGSDIMVAFITQDGLLYAILTASTGSTPDTTVASNIIAVDINGGKGPNRFGRDFFYLIRLPEGKGVQPLGFDQSYQSVANSCSYKGDGWRCAEYIKRSGWQIDDAYPWR